LTETKNFLLLGYCWKKDFDEVGENDPYLNSLQQDDPGKCLLSKINLIYDTLIIIFQSLSKLSASFSLNLQIFQPQEICLLQR